MSDTLSRELIQSTHSASQRNTVSTIAFQNIWISIVNGEFEPLEPVTEEDLAKRYDVSRTPLREAIQRLIGIGLITRLPNRTMVISELNIDHMVSLSTTRERIEGLISYNVWERYHAGVVSLDKLQAIHARMKKMLKLEDEEMLLSLGIQFHHELCRLSNNHVAVDILNRLLLALEPYRRLVIGDHSRIASIVKEHDRFIKQLKSEDGDAAEKLMCNHIKSARAFYRKQLTKKLPASST